MDTEANQQSDEMTAIANDLSCISCGYNLRALAPTGLCPECGTDIARSGKGDLLIHANRKWLRGIHHGTYVMSASLISILLSTIVLIFVQIAFDFPASKGWFRVFKAVSEPLELLFMINLLAVMVSVWIVTRQEPRMRMFESATSSRRVARAAILMTLVCFGLTPALPRQWIGDGRFALMICFAVSLGSCLKHFEMLALRGHREDVAKGARWIRIALNSSGLGLAVSCVFYLAFSAMPSLPGIVQTLAELGRVLCALTLFFSSIIALGVLGGFRRLIREVLGDAGTA